MHWWWNDGWSWWSWTLMTIGMVVFWALVARAFMSLSRSSDRADPPRSPEQVLAQRFAAGEIDGDDYNRRLDTLHSTETGHSSPRLQEEGMRHGHSSR